MDLDYIGDELEIFRHAANWKKYYGRLISPFFGQSVLEVGAGIGATTESLSTDDYARWVCLEPDTKMAAEITRKIDDGILPKFCEIANKTIDRLAPDDKFDSILYIDVLEHIRSDRAEIEAAANHLNKGGHLIVLSPAHQALYTPFDKSIGHFRRYNKKTLSILIPKNLCKVKLHYLDCVGAFASIANKLMLRQAMPTLNQILIWDRKMIPLSVFFDPLLGFHAGKSIIGIWRKS